jgi:hypothetical protein
MRKAAKQINKRVKKIRTAENLRGGKEILVSPSFHSEQILVASVQRFSNNRFNSCSQIERMNSLRH